MMTHVVTVNVHDKRLDLSEHQSSWTALDATRSANLTRWHGTKQIKGSAWNRKRDEKGSLFHHMESRDSNATISWLQELKWSGNTGGPRFAVGKARQKGLLSQGSRWTRFRSTPQRIEAWLSVDWRLISSHIPCWPKGQVVHIYGTTHNSHI